MTAQFLGKIDHNSLSVQDDYIFVKVQSFFFVEYVNIKFVVVALRMSKNWVAFRKK